MKQLLYDIDKIPLFYTISPYVFYDAFTIIFMILNPTKTVDFA